MPIRVLSQSLINKIAAGEVIERPASVVKELMENAVDAGAARIDVAIEQGGLELVRVVDDGGGIPAEELPLALAPHATSKLAEPDDLFRVATLGFRGEALASIAEVSRLLLRSRTAESQSGAELAVDGGIAGEVVPCGCTPGTAVEVRSLFFNTPVRRKFLRTPTTEFGHVAEAFTRIALASPHVHFTLRHNDRPVFELPAAEGEWERIARFFGRELADALIRVESRDEPVSLSGYVAHPSQSRSHNRMQYFFLNGRHIRDRALQHALGEAYRGLLMVGRYPIAFLTFHMPPDTVDVNVHPTKLEVRFRDSSRLYSQLLSTLRARFLSSDLNTRVQTPVGADAAPAFAAEAAAAVDPTGGHDAARAAQLRQQLVDWAKGQVTAWDTADGPGAEAAARAAFAVGRRDDAQVPLSVQRIDRPEGFPAPRGAERHAEPDAQPDAEASGPHPSPITPHPSSLTPHPSSLTHHPSPLTPHPSPLIPALQIHNRYLVAESEEGVLVIDQHALHERILYEHLRRRVEAGTIETQALLVPEALDLSPAEAAAALEHRGLLAELGVRVEPFGGSTVLLAGFPAMLANLGPADVLRGLLEQILSGKSPDRRDLLDRLLHAIACKAAIKAGDRLSSEEIATLLAQRCLIDDAHHCPHGRPTALIFTREELDRQFKRA